MSDVIARVEVDPAEEWCAEEWYVDPEGVVGIQSEVSIGQRRVAVADRRPESSSARRLVAPIRVAVNQSIVTVKQPVFLHLQ